jgi:hypothetical protein
MTDNPPVPDISEADDDEIAKVLTAAIRHTRTCISELAIRVRVLKAVRADRNMDDETIMEAATAYRKAEADLQDAIRREVNLHVAAAERVEES